MDGTKENYTEPIERYKYFLRVRSARTKGGIYKPNNRTTDNGNEILGSCAR